VMALCSQHTFQVLTKQSARMLEYINWQSAKPDIINRHNRGQMIDRSGYIENHLCGFTNGRWPLPNIWLGVTAEDQVRADERIPDLLKCPAAKRFVSCVPLLGEIDLSAYLHLQFGKSPDCCNVRANCGDCNQYPCISKPNENQLDQVICGGESGPGARLCQNEWIASIVNQCKEAGVAVFVKQLHLNGKAKAIKDITEFPPDLRIREMPFKGIEI